MNIKYLNVYKKKSFDNFKGTEWVNPSIPVGKSEKLTVWLTWVARKHGGIRKWELFVHNSDMVEKNWTYDIDNSILSKRAEKELIQLVFSDDFINTYKKYLQ